MQRSPLLPPCPAPAGAYDFASGSHPFLAFVNKRVRVAATGLGDAPPPVADSWLQPTLPDAVPARLRPSPPVPRSPRRVAEA